MTITSGLSLAKLRPEEYHGGAFGGRDIQNFSLAPLSIFHLRPNNPELVANRFQLSLKALVLDEMLRSSIEATEPDCLPADASLCISKLI